MRERGRGVINFPAVFYDVIVKRYVMRGHEQQFRDITADLARLRPGDTVLDVGCGTGTMALTAKRAVGDAGRVVGVDPSAQLLAGARRKAAKAGADIDFQRASIDQINVPDTTFDVAMGTFMVHHLPQDTVTRGVTELHRVLKPGGRLLMIDFVRTEEDKANPEKFGEGTTGITELASLLQAHDFTAVELGQIPIPIHSVARSHNEYGYVLATRGTGKAQCLESGA